MLKLEDGDGDTFEQKLEEEKLADGPPVRCSVVFNVSVTLFVKLTGQTHIGLYVWQEKEGKSSAVSEVSPHQRSFLQIQCLWIFSISSAINYRRSQ